MVGYLRSSGGHMPQKKYKPNVCISATDAIAYLQIARPTFYRYVRDGIIIPAETVGGISKRYRVQDLDKARAVIERNAHNSPTGISSVDKTYEAMDDTQAVAQASSLFQQQHKSTLEKFRTSIAKALPENQDLLRATLLHVGVERGVIEKFFTLLEQGTPAAQMKAIEEWFSQVLPRQQNTKKELNPGAEWLRVIDRMEGIQHSIVKSLHGGPLVEIDGPILDAEFLEEIEVPALEGGSS